jgi:hypothetical protein
MPNFQRNAKNPKMENKTQVEDSGTAVKLRTPEFSENAHVFPEESLRAQTPPALVKPPE